MIYGTNNIMQNILHIQPECWKIMQNNVSLTKHTYGSA